MNILEVMVMKIVKEKDWRFRSYERNFLDKGGVFVFEHKQYGDILALKAAKYIASKLDVVLFLNAESSEKVSVSESKRKDLQELLKIYDVASAEGLLSAMSAR